MLGAIFLTVCYRTTPASGLTQVKKTRFPDSNTKREPCRPALLDIGESLSAYLQADFNIIPYYSVVNTFCENFTKIFRKPPPQKEVLHG